LALALERACGAQVVGCVTAHSELNMDTISLNVVFYEDGDLWVAQAIEYDIAARASALSKLPRAFERAVIASLAINHELGRPTLEGIGPAPQAFRDLFEKAHFSLSERDGTISPPAGIEIGDFRLAEFA
jgi:hypothetical protein